MVCVGIALSVHAAPVALRSRECLRCVSPRARVRVRVSAQFAEAAPALERAAALNPARHGVWFTLGCVRIRLENWDGAAAAFRRATSLDLEVSEAKSAGPSRDARSRNLRSPTGRRGVEQSRHCLHPHARSVRLRATVMMPW